MSVGTRTSTEPNEDIQNRIRSLCLWEQEHQQNLERISKIGYGHLCLREDNLSFSNKLKNKKYHTVGIILKYHTVE